MGGKAGYCVIKLNGKEYKRDETWLVNKQVLLSVIKFSVMYSLVLVVKL